MSRHSFRSLVLGHLLSPLSSGETSSIYYYQFSDDVNPSPSLVHHVLCMHYKSAEQNMHSQLHKEVNEMHHNSVRRISPDDTFSHTQLLPIRIRMAIEWTRPATIRRTLGQPRTTFSNVGIILVIIIIAEIISVCVSLYETLSVVH